MPKFVCSYAHDIACFADFVVEAKSERAALRRIKKALADCATACRMVNCIDLLVFRTSLESGVFRIRAGLGIAGMLAVATSVLAQHRAFPWNVPGKMATMRSRTGVVSAAPIVNVVARMAGKIVKMMSGSQTGLNPARWLVA